MIIDGRTLAEGLYSQLKHVLTESDITPHVTIFTAAPNFETQKFLALKKRRASEVGIAVNVIEFPATITTDELTRSIAAAVSHTHGIVVQLPLPPQVDVDAVLATIPQTHDVDAFQYRGEDTAVLPPVVGAIAVIARAADVVWRDRVVTVVGRGRLVGKPAALWAKQQGARVTVVDKDTPEEEAQAHIKAADIIITGAGQPHFIKAKMVKKNAAIFDAGTSEVAGVLQGDVCPGVIYKASVFTPVPGGIGPLTVALLLINTVRLAGIAWHDDSNHDINQ